ncbi:GNAT family N-acetyltransferase [Alkaliphilus hydrothermalis]|uniref:Ribosomal protein S18 acetylase RimI-like enzyme n=1 Tax=Alkaliphilus hydrothermalis TaxID=1482730 RepID=A0ABS2NTV8_9FIRM|nr:GNAT family N-acetyltransferase [Alkaliphilus hydrothermalis]MBM7616388.1 ribosomal protein S18 acetylase RimI-like enzyme [Alkaliphilus hydrothermalis]
MEIVFHEMRTEHHQQVLHLFNKLQGETCEVSFAEILNEEDLQEKVNEKGVHFYVALEGEAVVAVFRGRQGVGNKNHAAFLTIAIDASSRRKGLAKNFTNYCLGDLKKKGVTVARAYVYSNNKPSINTILSAGFTFAGCVYQHHKIESTGEYVDDLIFHKIL